MFETETIGPFLVWKLKWGGPWLPFPPSGFVPVNPICNSRVVIDHTFMTISLNLAGFTDFFLLETLTSFLLPF